MEGASAPEVPSSFTAAELTEFLTRGERPIVASRSDDTPVLMGQTGPRRRATTNEVRALIRQLNDPESGSPQV